MLNKLSPDTFGTAVVYSAPPNTAVVSAVKPVLPEFIRLPKPGHLCSWTGLSRSKLNELILACPANGQKPPVRSVCLRKAGAKKGTRLIFLASLLGFLQQHAEGGQEEA